MAEKIGFGDAKKNNFSEQMGFRKKSNVCLNSKRTFVSLSHYSKNSLFTSFSLFFRASFWSTCSSMSRKEVLKNRKKSIKNQNLEIVR
ncbi:MAG: hypothetical protein V4494_06290 [Chlamydiota bacterium]